LVSSGCPRVYLFRWSEVSDLQLRNTRFRIARKADLRV
jgi:hypothetical protein